MFALHFQYMFLLQSTAQSSHSCFSTTSRDVTEVKSLISFYATVSNQSTLPIVQSLQSAHLTVTVMPPTNCDIMIKKFEDASNS